MACGLETADVTAIPLARRLPGASSNLPERLVRTDLGPVPAQAGKRSRAVPIRSCSRWGLPCRCRCRQARCALTAPFHPYRGQNATRPRRFVLCGTVPEARPEGRSPPDVIRHRLSMEPGLSSPAAFRHWREAAVRPTDTGRNGVQGGRRQAGRAAAVKKGPDLSSFLSLPQRLSAVARRTKADAGEG
jgi:hypothetical protein